MTASPSLESKLMKRQILFIILALSSAPCLPTATAQVTRNYQLTWAAMDAGGNSSTGGVYTASGAIGQPAATPTTAGPYTSVGGFLGGTDAGETSEPCTPLHITAQPRSITNTCSSGCATFAVGVSGSAPISAQWYFNGTPIPGANALTHMICPVTPAHEGIYSVSLSNECSRVDSERALLVFAADTTPPVIICPSNIVVWTCNSNGVSVNYPMPVVTDDQDATPTVVCTPPSGSIFPPGTTTVTCEAFDDCTNRVRCAFTVTVVVDTTPPVVRCPSNMVVCATSARGAVVNFAPPTADDDYSQNVTYKYMPDSGSTFPMGDTAVICEATDECGNTSRCEFIVRVVEPKLTIAKTAAGLVITWENCGILEEADTPAGTWTPLTSATSPHVVAPAMPMKFYRLRNQ